MPTPMLDDRRYTFTFERAAFTLTASDNGDDILYNKVRQTNEKKNTKTLKIKFLFYMINMCTHTFTVHTNILQDIVRTRVFEKLKNSDNYYR